MNTGLLLFIGIIVVIVFAVFISLVPYIRLQRRAKAEGVDLGLSKIMGMRMRKTNPAKIIALLIKAKREDIAVTPDMLETQYIAGGNAARVVESLILAKQAGLPLEYRLAGAVDLSGGDAVAFVEALKSADRTYTEQEVREAARNFIEALNKP
jgi:uncharacterized protein YqfA (UPF0365 family)